MKALLSCLLLGSAAALGGQSSDAGDIRINASSVDGGGGAASGGAVTLQVARIGGFVGSSSSSNNLVSAGFVPQVRLGSFVDLCNFASWASQFFVSGQPLNAPADDFDNDGQTNEEEFLALTDPTSARSTFQVEIVRQGGAFDIVFQPRASTSLRRYRLLRSVLLSDSFTEPSSSPQSQAVDGGGVFRAVGVSGQRGFFRVQIEKR